MIGPAVGGVLIGAFGVGPRTRSTPSAAWRWCGRWWPWARSPHCTGDGAIGVRRSIADGLRFVRGNEALVGSFVVDLVAMTFGMPRALFPVLAVSVYHAGAEGTGLLFAAVSAGATVAALTTGWLEHARRLGPDRAVGGRRRGAAIALAGLAGSLALAAVLLAIAGAADSVSAVCRSTINQTVTPDAMRGRMSSVFSLVVTSGPRLGDVESGAVAGLTGPRFSVASGGLACMAGVAVVAVMFPALVHYDAEAAIAKARRPSSERTLRPRGATLDRIARCAASPSSSPPPPH